MRTERDLYNWLRSNLHGHWQRIETTTGSGVPDVNRCHKGVESWFELKVHTGPAIILPEKAEKKARGAQVGWMKERSAHGGRCFLLLATNFDELSIFRVHPPGTLDTLSSLVAVIQLRRVGDRDFVAAALK